MMQLLRNQGSEKKNLKTKSDRKSSIQFFSRQKSCIRIILGILQSLHLHFLKSKIEIIACNNTGKYYKETRENNFQISEKL